MPIEKKLSKITLVFVAVLFLSDGLVCELSGLEGGPLVPLHVVYYGGEHGEHADRLDAHEAPVVQLRLRAPAQERGHVLRQLRGRRRRAVRELGRLRTSDITSCSVSQLINKPEIIWSDI